MSTADMLREFHTAYGLPLRSKPELGGLKEQYLRSALLDEETTEACIALLPDGNIAQVAQELADVVYVCYGTAVQFGIDLDAVLAEVHRANMSKVEPDGTVLRRDDGKILKGSAFRAADVAAALGLVSNARDGGGP